ncbi:MAG: hypothetical protein AUJ76_02425 [Candidatus Omnitrophica bacterium CG1_02_41_171]|nr:MAG: hypothetical protein AUJ76_02425 [Candidatus Omnitrophica bacterium CG1_02_41_171]HCG76779.1 hypothetical protein [bacterium]
MKNYRYRWGLAVLLLLVTGFRLWYIQQIPISADEAYFWQWSRHLSLCYYDQPPMIAYFIFLFTHLGRSNLLFIRLLAPLFMAATSLVMHFLARDISGKEEIGFACASLVLITPVFALGALLALVEAPLTFFWILTLYFVYQAVCRNRHSCWYAAGASLGLGMLTKYLILLLVPSIFLFLLSSPKNRQHFKSKKLWLSLLIALFIFSPVIFWNAKHHWVNFIFNFTQRHSSASLSLHPQYFGEFLAGQAGIISPLLFILLLYAIIIGGEQGMKERNNKLLFLFFGSATTLFLFAVYSLFDRPSPHWPANAYLSGFILLFLVLHQIKWKKAFSVLLVVATFFSLSFTVILHLLPLRPNILDRFIREKNAEESNEFISFLSNWPKTLGEKIGEIKEEMEKKNKTFILCRGFALAGYLSFYTPKQEETYCLFQETLQGQAYRYWQNLNAHKGEDALYMETGEKSAYLERLRKAFITIKKEPLFIISKDGKIIKKISIYRAYNFQGSEFISD